MVSELGVPVLHFDGTREVLVPADGVMRVRAEWWLLNGPAPLDGALCWEGNGPAGRYFAAVREECDEADAQVRANVERGASLVLCRPRAVDTSQKLWQWDGLRLRPALAAHEAIFQVVLPSAVELGAGDRYCLGCWIAAALQLYLGERGLVTAGGAPVPLSSLRVVSGATVIEPAPAAVRALETFPF